MLVRVRTERVELASADAAAALRVSACLALIGGALWPLPELLRSSSATKLGFVYVALVGCASFAACLALRPPERDAADAQGSWSRALTLGAGLAIAPLCGLGYGLKIATHHRPLGAATFAVLALIVFALLVLLARAVLSLGDTRPKLASVLVYGFVAGGVLGGACASFWLVRSVMQHATPAGPLLDACLGLALVGVLSRVRVRWLERWPRATRGALPVCCGLWLASLWLVRSDLDVRATVKSAPVVAGVVGLVVH
jgi:hypothetical protein